MVVEVGEGCIAEDWGEGEVEVKGENGLLDLITVG